MTPQSLAVWIIGVAAAVGGYFVLKHLLLRYMSQGGQFYYSGSDNINFSTDGRVRPVTEVIGNGTTAPDAACGDGGGTCN